jgi:uncharacterized protein
MMHPAGTFRVAAGSGRGFGVAAGQTLQVVNIHGTQVVDTWAFASAEEYLSLEHCREVAKKLFFEVGDTLVSNLYRPVLTLIEDTSPGLHDTLIAACNRRMYELAGRSADHPNCADNLRDALNTHGIAATARPCPWNLFMVVPVIEGRRLDFLRPRTQPGQSVTLRAECNCLIVFSACPDDVYPTNGGDGKPADVDIVIA